MENVFSSSSSSLCVSLFLVIVFISSSSFLYKTDNSKKNTYPEQEVEEKHGIFQAATHTCHFGEGTATQVLCSEAVLTGLAGSRLWPILPAEFLVSPCSFGAEIESKEIGSSLKKKKLYIYPVISVDKNLTHTFKFPKRYLAASMIFSLLWLLGHGAKIFMISSQSPLPLE